jgi:tetratricopeptide (TPR) repeat protein
MAEKPRGDASALEWITHAEILDFDGYEDAARQALVEGLDRCATQVESHKRSDVGVALARALTVATTLAEKGALARAHALLGRMAEHLDDKDGAHEHYLTALELYENMNDRAGVAATCELLARLHARLDDPEGAEAYWRYGLSLATAEGNRAEEARIMGILGRLALVSGDLDGAEDMLREAMTLEEALGRSLEEGFLTADLARVERARGDEIAAKTLFDAAIARLVEARAEGAELEGLQAERDGKAP